MALHSQRKRRALRDAQEAAGARLWSGDVPRPARVKIAGFWEHILENTTGGFVHPTEWDRGVAGILKLQGGHDVVSIRPDDLVRIDDPDLALDIIGAVCLFISERRGISSDWSNTFQRFVNLVFEDFRVAYRIVDAEVLPIASDELHTEVVEPALRLLVGKAYGKAHSAYISAIKEIPVDPADAITDAGTALQETLTALGCEGNALGPLIASAKKKGLLAAHDAKLQAGIESFLSWASADRSQTGDGHHVSNASRSDAWLMVHVVGALVVRLVDPSARATP